MGEVWKLFIKISKPEILTRWTFETHGTWRLRSAFSSPQSDADVQDPSTDWIRSRAAGAREMFPLRWSLLFRPTLLLYLQSIHTALCALSRLIFLTHSLSNVMQNACCSTCILNTMGPIQRRSLKMSSNQTLRAILFLYMRACLSLIPPSTHQIILQEKFWGLRTDGRSLKKKKQRELASRVGAWRNSCATCSGFRWRRASVLYFENQRAEGHAVSCCCTLSDRRGEEGKVCVCVSAREGRWHTYSIFFRLSGRPELNGPHNDFVCEEIGWRFAWQRVACCVRRARCHTPAVRGLLFWCASTGQKYSYPSFSVLLFFF